MRKLFGKFILMIFGWKASFPTEYKFPKMVILAAPHTSNWDLVFAFASYWKLGLYPNFLFYGNITNSFAGYFIRKVGGIGVDKTQDKGMVAFSTELFDKHRELLLVITPEGSRRKVNKWRTGFFHIAKNADVPLCLGKLDYNQKRAGIGGMLNMSGNFEKDMNYIQKFYQNSNPKYPERYNANIF